MKDSVDNGLVGTYFIMLTRGDEQHVVVKGLSFDETSKVAKKFVKTGSSWGDKEYRELSVCFLEDENDEVFEIIRFRRGQAAPIFDYSADWLSS